MKPNFSNFHILDNFVPIGIIYDDNQYTNMEQFELEILKKMYILKKLFPTSSTEKDKEEIAILRERITYLKTKLIP